MNTKNNDIQPFVKWAGGKRQLLTEITSLLPKKFETYVEPFIGGGALLFHLQPSKAIINDLNSELMNVYVVIKIYPEELIEDLKKHKNTSEYFYAIRALYKDFNIHEVYATRNINSIGSKRGEIKELLINNY